MIRVHISRAARLAVACVAVLSINGPTNAGLPADYAPARDWDVRHGLPSLDLAVCGDPLVMLESEKTNVLRILLGEDAEPLQVAGR
ncbi:hypothetical protein [Pseudomonas savastanoi]|uniref:hypothetical protein n=1 Tax=Pseudomonas savastanoi TaxID=29438 RepID=UPI000F0082ED|nr:hypothetical protein [Pseudomonas savastanoi]RMM98935.1 hypothetical protein ALQ68_01681 [Pseudomonas savastanoi pv. glycinea]RMP90688.1 hypothetical protein ALQ13_02667 [Pseudomonas savastanoi pv. glycinea]